MLKLIVLSIAFTTVFKAFEACDQGWHQFENSCYFSSAFGGNSKAEIQARARHWYGAKDECKRKGAKLAEINTKAELQFVRQLAMKLFRNVWIGGTDAASEGQWNWASGAPIAVSDFKPEEISDQQKEINRPERQDCLAIVTYLHYHWRDIVCIQRIDYICEKENNS